MADLFFPLNTVEWIFQTTKPVSAARLPSFSSPKILKQALICLKKANLVGCFVLIKGVADESIAMSGLPHCGDLFSLNTVDAFNEQSQYRCASTVFHQNPSKWILSKKKPTHVGAGFVLFDHKSGIEPASKQGSLRLSTCLSCD